MRGVWRSQKNMSCVFIVYFVFPAPHSLGA